MEQAPALKFSSQVELVIDSGYWHIILKMCDYGYKHNVP